MSIRIMIVDDHDVVRRGLAVFLRAFKDMELVGQASDGQEAVQLCQQLNPHVILMDMVMPLMNGIAATKAIRQTKTNAQIIALTSFEDEEMIQAMLDAGAVGYMFKNASVSELAEAIRRAAVLSQSQPESPSESPQASIQK